MAQDGLYKWNGGRCLSGMNLKIVFIGAGMVVVVGLVCLMASAPVRGTVREPKTECTFEYTMPVTNTTAATNGAAQTK